MSKIIFSGLESSGKSLRLAMVVSDIVHRNSKWYKKSGIVRPIYSNLKFSDTFVEYAQSVGIPIKYWNSLDQLIEIRHADVIIDEVGNYFDARTWTELSLDTRRWLTQGAKQGIEIYGTAQDFAQVDKAFRRLVGGLGGLFHIRKLVGSARPSATRPPVKRIWGLCTIQELEPMGYDEETSKFKPKGMLPRFFSIQRRYCEVFDTGQKIERSPLPKLRHLVRMCEDDTCGLVKTSHI